jgi:AcrR family transcriptional regulator
VSDRIEAGPGSGGLKPRERIEAAIVELVGSHGYEATTVAAVCAAADTDRIVFDGYFEGKEDCFLRVHGAVTDELCLLVNAAYASPASWQDRIWAAGWAGMRFLHAEPLRARFLVVGVNGAGSRAQGRRDRVIEGLADLIDGGRGELDNPAAVTRNTAEMIAGAIYSTVLGKLQGGSAERREHFLPELIYMATMPYLGSRAAEDALAVQTLG